jgi:hypothetical protein
MTLATQAELLSLTELPERDLDQAELVALVTALATDSQTWQQHIAFSDDERHYVSLHRDAHVDVWLLCWTPTNDTGWHDHDASAGAVGVVQGELLEHQLLIGVAGATEAVRGVTAGEVFGFGPEHIHRLTGQAAGSVSIHAYSPPLNSLGQYTVASDGVLRRTPVSYTSELRSFDDIA